MSTVDLFVCGLWMGVVAGILVSIYIKLDQILEALARLGLTEKREP
jgi:hypothetical protein